MPLFGVGIRSRDNLFTLTPYYICYDKMAWVHALLIRQTDVGIYDKLAWVEVRQIELRKVTT